jgi:hypothetical protein
MRMPSLIDGLQEERGWNLVIFLGLKIFRFLLVVFVAGLVLFAIWHLPLRVIATKANNNGNFILAILTLALVAITGFYAIVTYKMLVQIRESGRSEVRPLFWINVASPEFTMIRDEFRQFSSANMVVANYGKGSAVGIRAQYSIPYRWNDEDNRPDEIVASVKDAPMLLSHGGSFETRLSITTPLYDLKKCSAKFLQIRILYEDTQRNLYKMNLVYDLSVMDLSKTYYSLGLRREKLVTVAFSDRRYVGDLDDRFSGGEGDKDYVIYDRRSLR